MALEEMLPETASVPALIVVVPLYVFAALLRVSVPVPFFVRAPVPEITPERVWLLFEPMIRVPLFAMFAA